MVILASRRRFAGAERGSRVLQGNFNICYGRVRATQNAPRDPFRVFERRHGLSEIVKRGGRVPVERIRINPPRPERGFIILAEDTSRHR